MLGNIHTLDIQVPHEIVQYWGWFRAFGAKTLSLDNIFACRPAIENAAVEREAAMANAAGKSNDGVLKDRRFVLRRLQRRSNRASQMKFSDVICNVRSADMRQRLQALGMGHPP